MPYIPQEQREQLSDAIAKLLKSIKNIPGWEEQKAGILNYTITMIAQGMIDNELRYAKINEIIGALECAKQEFYRRVAEPYEDSKIESAGDVYEKR